MGELDLVTTAASRRQGRLVNLPRRTEHILADGKVGVSRGANIPLYVAPLDGDTAK